MSDEINRSIPLSQLTKITIENARTGDTESARKILQWFCGAIKANTYGNGKPYVKPSGTGTQIDERILRYLAECFQKILEGAPGARVDANHALGLVEPRKKGRKNTKAKRQRDLDMFYKVNKRREQISAERKQRSTKRLPGELSPLDTAIDEVAKEYSVSYQTVKNAYDEVNRDINTAFKPTANQGN